MSDIESYLKHNGLAPVREIVKELDINTASVNRSLRSMKKRNEIEEFTIKEGYRNIRFIKLKGGKNEKI